MTIHQRGRDALHGLLLVGGVDFVAGKAPAAFDRGHAGGAAAHEGVVHHLVAVGVELDAAPRQLDREGGRMADAPGRFGAHLPDAARVAQKLVAANRVAAAVDLGAAVVLLAEEEDVLVLVADGGIGGRAPAAPGGRAARAAALVPDDLAAHEEAEPFHVLDDVGVQRNVRLAADVGDVDADAAAGHEDPPRLLPRAAQQLAVLWQGEVLIVRLADRVGR